MIFQPFFYCCTESYCCNTTTLHEAAKSIKSIECAATYCIRVSNKTVCLRVVFHLFVQIISWPPWQTIYPTICYHTSSAARINGHKIKLLQLSYQLTRKDHDCEVVVLCADEKYTKSKRKNTQNHVMSKHLLPPKRLSKKTKRHGFEQVTESETDESTGYQSRCASP